MAVPLQIQISVDWFPVHFCAKTSIWTWCNQGVQIGMDPSSLLSSIVNWIFSSMELIWLMKLSFCVFLMITKVSSTNLLPRLGGVGDVLMAFPSKERVPRKWSWKKKMVYFSNVEVLFHSKWHLITSKVFSVFFWDKFEPSSAEIMLPNRKRNIPLYISQTCFWIISRQLQFFSQNYQSFPLLDIFVVSAVESLLFINSS